jgi:hypothetical protein
MELGPSNARESETGVQSSPFFEVKKEIPVEIEECRKGPQAARVVPLRDCKAS